MILQLYIKPLTHIKRDIWSSSWAGRDEKRREENRTEQKRREEKTKIFF